MDPNGFSDGVADIELVDLASGAAPTTLVTGAKPEIFLTPDKKTIIRRPAGAAHPGVYEMRLPLPPGRLTSQIERASTITHTP